MRGLRSSDKRFEESKTKSVRRLGEFQHLEEWLRAAEALLCPFCIWHSRLMPFKFYLAPDILETSEHSQPGQVVCCRVCPKLTPTALRGAGIFPEELKCSPSHCIWPMRRLPKPPCYQNYTKNKRKENTKAVREFQWHPEGKSSLPTSGLQICGGPGSTFRWSTELCPSQ